MRFFPLIKGILDIKYDEIKKKCEIFIKNPYFPIEKIQNIM